METSAIEIDRSSEKNFGIVFAIVFGAIGFFLYWKSGEPTWWLFAIAAAFLITAFARPTLLKIPNLLWFKFGMLLGSIVAPIVMALVYVTTLVPMGLFIKLTGKDLLHIKLDRQSKSYWIDRTDPIQPMKNQF